MLILILALGALTCFVLAAFGVPVQRINLVALGFAILTVAWLATAYFDVPVGI